MIVEQLWPLAFLLAVPVLIILYLLVPKGKDTTMSSNLLWQKVLQNQQSKTRWEKFIHNLLLYLQIVIVLLLVLALVSPALKQRKNGSTDVVYVIDTSGSMKHLVDGDGKQTRLQAAVKEIQAQIAGLGGARISLVTCDGTGSNLLAVHTSDQKTLSRTLGQLQGSDTEGNLADAVSTVQTIRGTDAKTAVIVYTDGIGEKQTKDFRQQFLAQIRVMGKPVCNVANTFLSCTKDSGKDTYTAAAGVTNYSDYEAELEISLYEGTQIIAVRTLSLAADETYTCLFEDIVWQNQPLHTELSAVTFAGTGEGDSLEADNRAYAVREPASTGTVALVGEGNTYIENACLAVTGENPIKAKTDDALAQTDVDICIFDADTAGQWQQDQTAMVFAKESPRSKKQIRLTMGDTGLTNSIASFSFGVNQTYLYDLPAWATGFLWYGDACAAYYGECDGIRQVVLGFDLRESDFALQPEFPVFMNEALQYLTDRSLLAKTVYDAGDVVQFHAISGVDTHKITAPTDQAGCFYVKADGKKEPYVVRFASASQSDGRVSAADSNSSVSRQTWGTVRLRPVILVLVLIFLILEWICYVRQMRYRGRFYWAVRLAGLSLLLLALCGISLPIRPTEDTTVFLVDLSESNRANRSDMEQYINSQVAAMPKGNRYGVVAFGANALVEQFLTKEKQTLSILSTPQAQATNLEDAVSSGLSMIGDASAGRLVLLTDGKQTKGNIEHTASALQAKQVELLSVLYENKEEGTDAYIADVAMPEYLHPKEAYTMTVTVESNYETDAKLQLLQGTEQISQTRVHLNKGTNRLLLKQTVAGEEARQYTVRIKAPGDTCAENNDFCVYANVDAPPKILVVSGMHEDRSPFLQLLDTAGCNYRCVSAAQAPQTLEELLAYKSILLENVYRDDLPEGFLNNLTTYVKDYGCGLIACGGEDSFALGGYKDTELETLLPVDMQLRGINEKQTLAMVMVIDHSGSMSEQTDDATNLDLAIAAADAAVDQLDEKDEVGVVTFDDAYTWQVPMQNVTDKAEIKSLIESVSDGGGTTIKPAVRAALNEIQKSRAALKHIVLLTDGQGETKNFTDIIADCNAADVTLSTVAVGTQADTGLLQQLAAQCGGRYYASDLASDIPKIFAQEVFLSGDSYLQNGDFSLAVRPHAITKDLFENGWPKIKGYVSASPKTGARVLIASDEKDDPILSVMQYGLGHTVAWNSDVTNRWTAALAGQEDYVSLWKRIVDYSVGNTSGEDRVDVKTADGTADVTYYASDYTEKTQVKAVYTDPDGATKEVNLSACAPGTFVASFDTEKAGVYQINVRRVQGSEVENAVTTAAVVQYADEYKFALTNDAFRAFVRQYGTFVKPQKQIWGKLEKTARADVSLTNFFLILLLFWFVADVAMRRFAFVPPMLHWTKQKKKAIIKKAEDRAVPEKKPEKKPSGKPSVSVQTLDTAALLKKKEKRNSSAER